MSAQSAKGCTFTHPANRPIGPTDPSRSWLHLYLFVQTCTCQRYTSRATRHTVGFQMPRDKECVHHRKAKPLNGIYILTVHHEISALCFFDQMSSSPIALLPPPGRRSTYPMSAQSPRISCNPRQDVQPRMMSPPPPPGLRSIQTTGEHRKYPKISFRWCRWLRPLRVHRRDLDAPSPSQTSTPALDERSKHSFMLFYLHQWIRRLRVHRSHAQGP